MPQLCEFAITHKRPARHPERMQRHCMPTPNGAPVSILLDEIGLPCEPHLVGFYGASERVGFGDISHVQRVLASFVARPAVVAGLEIPKAAV